MAKTAIKTLILKHFYPLFLLTFGVVFALVVNNHVEVRAIVLEDLTLESAKIYATSIKKLRNVYATNVISKANLKGLKASHDFKGKDDTIPLPVTFSQQFIEEIRVDGVSLDAKVVSHFPFPWNQARELDSFETKALMQLQIDPKQPVYQFETVNGVKRVRYAVSDIMTAECIACHNYHPLTPKNDWKEGDLRGIISVTMPIRTSDFTGVSHIRENVISLIFIIGIYFFLGYQLMIWVRRP